jgi:hypothetical protein
MQIEALSFGGWRRESFLFIADGGWPGLGKIDIGEHGSLEENITSVLL